MSSAIRATTQNTIAAIIRNVTIFYFSFVIDKVYFEHLSVRVSKDN